uniref:Uncharacterized protein n=1 Tax=Glossina austeni TaxID=7395 RepID=A0A1A9V7J1_GLOAU
MEKNDKITEIVSLKNTWKIGHLNCLSLNSMKIEEIRNLIYGIVVGFSEIWGPNSVKIPVAIPLKLFLLLILTLVKIADNMTIYASVVAKQGVVRKCATLSYPTSWLVYTALMRVKVL